MKILIDTSAFLAVLNSADRYHASAKLTWDEILFGDTILFTSNYLVMETIAILQHRYGIEAVRLFEDNILPAIDIAWVDEGIHKQGISALFIANRRSLSLVDCTSFELMRQLDIDVAFTYDIHFQELGFKMIPERSIS